MCSSPPHSLLHLPKFVYLSFVLFCLPGTYTTSIAEDLGLGNIVATVTATDADIDDTMEYSMVTSTTMFLVDRITGDILVQRYLDREAQDQYTLEVKASDHGDVIVRSSTGTVSITITDANDNDPVFNPKAYR